MPDHTAVVTAVIGQRKELQEAVSRQPDLRSILEAAAAMRWSPGFSWVDAYEDLKHDGMRLVGWYASDREIQTERHYYAFIHAIEWLIPQTEADNSRWDEQGNPRVEVAA
jgi:hypothetical protein